MVTDEGSDLFEGGEAAAHVFEAAGIGDLIGDELDGGGGGGEGEDALSQLEDADLFGAADVVDLTDGEGVLGEPGDGLDDIEHVGEAAGLKAIAIDLEGLAGEGLADEAGDDHAVSPNLPWADGVEEAHDDDGEAELAVVGEAEEFVDGFGGGVGPTALVGGAHEAVVLFAEGDLDAFAVDFGGGGDEDFAAVAVGGFEDGFAAHDVGFDGADGVFDDEAHADGGGEVDDDLGLAGEAVEDLGIHDGLAHEGEALAIFEGLDVLEAAGGEIVDGDNLVTLVEQEMR